ncbi:WXG100 family type VII secretion target [Nocardia zapadnayensis]|uniref:WXG100 family type VII secretion target n=1 Tax=Nocardia rhamnosiphila TaxID=426716 RepID=UPI00224612AE|nr:WXG100 family type VII secretion target [Nocardia zapadnayensis]MCX0274640.1 WXG100 family type VII secretion target [Nocardia zapadnayensis]
MSSQFSVDLDRLDDLVARLSNLAGFIGERLDEIDDRVASLAGTGWEGVAAQVYVVAHNQWTTGAREFADGIREISEAAREAHTRYTEAIDVNYRMLSGG